MKERSVRFTATAQRHVKRENTWWLENRAYTDAFATEIEESLRILAIFPGVGTFYKEAGVSGLRRLYLRNIDCHLYYTFDEHEVIVRALWGARRRRGPGSKRSSCVVRPTAQRSAARRASQLLRLSPTLRAA